MRNITLIAVCALVGLVFLFTGCGPENGALAAPPVAVTYSTGDMNDTIDGQLGLTSAGPSAKVEGGFGFAGAATVSCGPHAGEFRLRFQPEGSASPVLTLRVPQPGYGGHGAAQGTDHGQGKGSARTDDPGNGHTTESHEPTAEARLLRIESGRVLELAGEARVSMHPATHAAGRHAVSGAFTAELEGTTLEGSFANCFHFAG